ncbi:MAG: hypothetical protein IT359_02010 [Gemmatimonadaceae bacterium]|nr:hypothetical protein [Gemmatimonadaceae bacterium]
MRLLASTAFLAFSLSLPVTVHAQHLLVVEGGVGIATPVGSAGQGRGIGASGYVSIRGAPSERSTTFGLLLDLSHMPADQTTTCVTCGTGARSPLHTLTLAGALHVESPHATRGMYAEGGLGITRLTLTSVNLTRTAPTFLAGVGAFARARGVPLRCGLEYHLHVSDVASSADMSPTQSVRVRVALWARNRR